MNANACGVARHFVPTRVAGLLLALAIAPAFPAGSFATLEAYVREVGGDAPSGGAMASSATHLFGALLWPCAARHACEFPDSRAGAVFVLKKVADGRLEEEARSAWFEWPIVAATPVIDRVEAEGTDRFSVSIQRFATLGQNMYRFALRDGAWVLSGFECDAQYMSPEDGDESVGDSGTRRSVNLLTGRWVETRHKANRSHSRIEGRRPVQPIPLSAFDPYSPKLPGGCT